MFTAANVEQAAYGYADLLAVFWKDIVRDLALEDPETLEWVWSEGFDWWAEICGVAPDTARVALLRRAVAVQRRYRRNRAGVDLRHRAWYAA